VCQDGSNDTEVFAWGDGSNGKLGNLIEDVRTRTRTPSDGRLTNESCHARYAAHSHSHNRHQCESRISMAARPSRCIAARSSLPCWHVRRICAQEASIRAGDNSRLMAGTCLLLLLFSSNRCSSRWRVHVRQERQRHSGPWPSGGSQEAPGDCCTQVCPL